MENALAFMKKKQGTAFSNFEKKAGQCALLKLFS
jgi:hypothetical protein